MKLAVIIPCRNEEAILGTLIPRLSVLRDDARILFVDGGSSDRTIAVLERAGERVVKSPRGGRAFQMNFGASQTDAEVLFFLHCDSIPPPDAVSEIREVLRTHDAGCFGIRFDRDTLPYRFGAMMSNRRVVKKKIMFGDQGIFLKREVFNAVGGFPELPLMEDYALSQRLLDCGFTCGLANSRIVTSARRFETGGMIRTVLLMKRLQRMYLRGDDIERIAALYRQKR